MTTSQTLLVQHAMHHLILPSAARLAGIELGGTHAHAALAEHGRIVAREHLAVGSPADTLLALARILADWDAAAPVAGLGIASFGPIRVDPAASDYGRMLATPKVGWSGADVLRPLAHAVSGPAAMHTDVTAAAIAEGAAGAARDCDHHAYITIGTGVGVGIVMHGVPLVGQLHPEAGHMRVRRPGGDAFSGACPFHGDCLEGLIAGPALRARFGRDPATVGDDDPCWERVADALAEACAVLFLTLSLQRIVVGGGVVAQRKWLLARAARLTGDKLAGYLPPVDGGADLRPAMLDHAGLYGALLMAGDAAAGKAWREQG